MLLLVAFREFGLTKYDMVWFVSCFINCSLDCAIAQILHHCFLQGMPREIFKQYIFPTQLNLTSTQAQRHNIPTRHHQMYPIKIYSVSRKFFQFYKASRKTYFNNLIWPVFNIWKSACC
ncbi:uncharacterized protein LOC133728050 isoform X2 [Rosa rugosa]|uniref:uncharacterized protein LOC133712319 isoform X2 n=1 Tax=Rosa rugosa TaxID=74645 RepID=UPI002B417189|nr:uncharacterized protein LOC133712319 isoform X2 [Rosa rugosa]XP_062011455.1 uncharacterized protein LOC133728050 isoform X2 [Rosa rugosa]